MFSALSISACSRALRHCSGARGHQRPTDSFRSATGVASSAGTTDDPGSQDDGRFVEHLVCEWRKTTDGFEQAVHLCAATNGQIIAS